MQKKIFQTILVIIFLDLLMFYQSFLSPQVKRIVIISNKLGIYKLLNDFKTYDLKKLGNIRKISHLLRIIA